MSLIGEGAIEQAGALAASLVGETLRRLELQNVSNPAQLLTPLGVALQRGWVSSIDPTSRPSSSFQLLLGPYSEAASAAVHAPLADMLGRGSPLRFLFMTVS